MSIKQKYFMDSRERLIEREFFIKLFAVVPNIETFKIDQSIISKGSYFIEHNPQNLVTETVDKTYRKYDLVITDTGKNKFYSYISMITASDDDNLSFEVINIEEFKGKPLIEFKEPITINPKDIENYKGPGSIKTSYGRYFLNYVLFVYPFQDRVAYINQSFNSGLVDGICTQKLIDNEVSIDDFKKYADALYSYGHFSEICVPTVSIKSLATSDEIIAKRKELIEANKDKLSDPLEAKKLNDILIKMERERLKGDPSERFYNSRGSSAWNIQRAKMHVNIGGVPDFSDDVGKITYMGRSLMDGWDKHTFDDSVNEIFKASYGRGVGTQLGGAQTNIIIRMFQSSKIIVDDCGTTKGIYFDITDKTVKDFYGMYEAVTNKVITKETAKSFINKKVLIRSPMTCITPGSGYCYKCFGDLYKKRGARSVELDGVYVSSKFMLLSMKNMHGTEIKTVKINLQDYFVSNF